MTGTINPEIPVVGTKEKVAEPKIPAAIETLRDALNSILTSENKIDATKITKESIADEKLVSRDKSYYPIYEQGAVMRSGGAAGTYLFTGGGNTESIVMGLVKSGSNVEILLANPFGFKAARYAITGKTTKLKLVGTIGTNSVKPLLKFTLGLYPVTVSGASNNNFVTAGTVVTGSTFEFNEPAKELFTQGESGDFVVPADGVYLIGMVTSATMTTNATATFGAQLLVKHE